MDFFSIILFLALYYVRPHEWFPLVAMMKPIMLAMLLALVSLFTEHRGIGFRDLFKTPHDWMMAALFLWTVGSSPEKMRTFDFVYNGFVFYWVTVLTLVNIKRIVTFLNWWTFFVVFLAAFALASEIGIDPTGSYSITHGRMKDRLILNTSIFNNPNALGHSIVPAVVMLYFTGFWKRPVFSKIFTPFAMLLPLTCLYLTESKGAFLSCFATILNALTFKRPKTVQILIVVLALTAGWTALQFMPRMNELQSSKTDQAIQGRVKAFHFGYKILTTTTSGVGFARFQTEFFKEHHFYKAAHSSYVNIGCELGAPGLCLFLGVIYCCLRTLIFAVTSDDEEERIRRTLFVLFVSYTVSSWMVDYENRATFYLMAAATAALHRYLISQRPANDQTAGVEIEVQPAPLLGHGVLSPIHIATSQITTALETTGSASITPPPPLGEPPPPKPAGINWNRIGWVDVVMIILMYQAAKWYWHYIMNKM